MTANEQVPAPGPLAGIRVLDLSRVLAGPFCSMLLADYGAEVVKVERPGSGDGTRRWGPPWVGDMSAYFMSANRNKRSVTLDLKQPQGRDLARRLAVESDILIENFKPGTMDRLELGYDRLAADNPSLVYCSISGYGQTGPYRERPGYDFMIQAQGGLMSVTGPPDGEPQKVGVAVVDLAAGMYAVSAILAALHHRSRTGEGQHVDIALLDSQIGFLSFVAQNYLASGEPPARHGNAHPNIVPYETFPTRDGQIALAVGTDEQYRRLCLVVDRPELSEDERFQSNSGRVVHREVLVPLLQDLFRQRPTAEWLDVLMDAGLAVSAVNDVPTLLADPQVQARKMVQSALHPTLGAVDLLGPVAKLSRTPASLRTAPPELGADTAAVLSEWLNCSPEELAQARASGVTGPEPSDNEAS